MTDKISLQELKARRQGIFEEFNSTKILELREKYGLNQECLAYLVRVARTTVVAWEDDNPPPKGPALVLLNMLDTHGIDSIIG